MTAALPLDLLGWAKDVGVPIATFMAGAVVARWSLTKKDRKELEQEYYKNTLQRIERHDAAYQDYSAALATYAAAHAATADNFFLIATKGERYFYELSMMSSAIQSGLIDMKMRDDVLLRKIRQAVSKTLPQHYETLLAIARKNGFPYAGELRRADYASLYAVVETYGPGPEWTEE